MKEFKHTPAPWSVIDGIQGGYVMVVGGYYSVARVLKTKIDYNKLRKLETVKANAKLIAAAPELLEALVEMVAFGTQQDWDHVVIEKSKSAIAKATQ
jgi:hypothetical protein